MSEALGVALVDHGRVVGTLSLWRELPGQPYLKRDEDFLALLAPRIVLGLRARAVG